MEHRPLTEDPDMSLSHSSSVNAGFHLHDEDISNDSHLSHSGDDVGASVAVELPTYHRIFELHKGKNRFPCGKATCFRLFGCIPITGPSDDMPANLCVWICLIVPSVIFGIFACPKLWDIAPALPILCLVCFLFTTTTLILTQFSDPGIVPRSTVPVLPPAPRDARPSAVHNNTRPAQTTSVGANPAVRGANVSRRVPAAHDDSSSSSSSSSEAEVDNRCNRYLDDDNDDDDSSSNDDRDDEKHSSVAAKLAAAVARRTADTQHQQQQQHPASPLSPKQQQQKQQQNKPYPPPPAPPSPSASLSSSSTSTPYPPPPVLPPPAEPIVELPWQVTHSVDGVSLNWRWCSICCVYRPPRTSHCRDCDNCIKEYDHHCPFVGQCVGQRNYAFFLGFVSSVFIYIAVVMVSTFILMSTGENGNKETRIVAFVILGIVGGIVLVLLCGLGGMHAYLLYKGKTTKELLGRKRDDAEVAAEAVARPYLRFIDDDLVRGADGSVLTTRTYFMNRPDSLLGKKVKLG